MYIIFIYQSILSFKTNFPFQKRKIYPTFALSPPKRIYSSKLTRTEGKILFTGIQYSRSTLSKHSRTLNFPSVSWKREFLPLSLSLWIFFHANGTRENRRIISRGEKREESVRAFSLFQVVVLWSGVLDLRSSSATPFLQLVLPIRRSLLQQSSPCCNGVSDVFEGARLVALSRHFNEEVEAPDGSGASATPLSGERGEGGWRRLVGEGSRLKVGLFDFSIVFICEENGNYVRGSGIIL